MQHIRIKDFADSKNYLKSTDFDNFFNVYLDKRNNYIYNLNKSMYFLIEDGATQEYLLKHDMHWTLVSYKLYGTTHLAWLLMKINNIDAAHVFDKIKAGAIVKYIPKEQLTTVINAINDESDD